MRLVLHDVDVGPVVAGVIRSSGLELSREDREDLEQHLLVEAWRASERYQPGIIAKGFGAYVTVTLKRRVVDFERRQWGRTTWKFGGPRPSTRTAAAAQSRRSRRRFASRS